MSFFKKLLGALVEPPAPAVASKSWDIYGKIEHPIAEGFPFDERYPPAYLGADAKYELVLRDGIRKVAKMETPPGFRSEGPRWVSISDGTVIPKDVVLCWALIG